MLCREAACRPERCCSRLRGARRTVRVGHTEPSLRSLNKLSPYRTSKNRAPPMRQCFVRQGNCVARVMKLELEATAFDCLAPWPSSAAGLRPRTAKGLRNPMAACERGRSICDLDHVYVATFAALGPVCSTGTSSVGYCKRRPFADVGNPPKRLEKHVETCRIGRLLH